MNSFRTELQTGTPPFTIDHSESILTVGSCFAGVIGKKLQENKFTVSANPFGTLYDPLSIHRAITYALHNEVPMPATYVESNGVWNSYDFHSVLSALSRSAAELNINNAIGATHHYLNQAQVLTITYGTARIFERKDTGERVANCHKVPSAQFTSRLCTPEDIGQSFDMLMETLDRLRPGIKIILTVSPVRHTKDTLERNGVSKSILRWACHRLAERYPAVIYFPSFEIMIDDLRDYRFYERDMIHPSAEAIDYIWEKFCGCFFTVPTRTLIARWQALASALHHRPFHPSGEAHRKFLTDSIRKLEELKPLLSVDQEIMFLKSQLTAPHEQ